MTFRKLAIANENYIGSKNTGGKESNRLWRIARTTNCIR